MSKTLQSDFSLELLLAVELGKEARVIDKTQYLIVEVVNGSHDNFVNEVDIQIIDSHVGQRFDPVHYFGRTFREEFECDSNLVVGVTNYNRPRCYFLRTIFIVDCKWIVGEVLQ